MRLNVDFSALETVASKFQSRRTFQLNLDNQPPLERIDIDLVKGIEIQLEDLDSEDGLLSYKGRHVILYIRDHGGKLDEAILDPTRGKRFHVADCETLESMRTQGRFERYVVTQSTSGDFEISGRSYATGRTTTGVARLKVCKNCLAKLNFNSYLLASRTEKSGKWLSFSLLEFFETYSTRFRQLPRGLASSEEASTYSKDWQETSRRLREASNYRCEDCQIVLREHMDLLHVHHVNGVKNDDRPPNLSVLCKDCHRKQPLHGHIFVSRREMGIISRLRAAQGIQPRTWDEAIRMADLAVRPTLELARHQRWDVPEFALNIPGRRGGSFHVEAAWARSKRAIVSVEGAEVPAEWRADTAGALLSELGASL
ncbi:HNH endonuclease signature motif containing protein [Luteimonas sp. MC1750]|uniref:HNH endonuclease n=1 Tax=Luteimonas sp. MC1750 TaxID=2799326 RepID=UPI0018F08F88|nr:HNH endonuclease signature motif containing protein [Luteimonas sp. MC1750]MBJ6983825.1 HNH endonuclease [Luteimonas sp. MC1750]QQO06651.1 HNH endonuclease [Luteimonas sp. MC1750]